MYPNRYETQSIPKQTCYQETDLVGHVKAVKASLGLKTLVLVEGAGGQAVSQTAVSFLGASRPLFS